MKSPPGHSETTVNGMRDELVGYNQRLTRLENELAKKVATSGTCATTAVILAVLAVLCSIATTVYLVVEAWS